MPDSVPATPEPAQDVPRPTPQFRTYASDVAKLTGKPLPKNVKNVPAPAKPAPTPPPARIIPKAPTTNETGEEVLTRLRGRAAEKAVRKEPVAKPAPPPAPEPAPAPEPEPELPPVRPPAEPTPVPASMPEMPRAALPEFPALPTMPQAPTIPVGIPPVPEKPVAAPEAAGVHTYKTDFSDRAEAGKISRIGMVAAQQDAQTAPVIFKQEKKQSGLLVIFLGGILVLAGIGSVYAAYKFATAEPAIPMETVIASLIFADERIQLSGSGQELREGLAEARGIALSDRDLAVVYMTYSTTTGAGIKEEIATGGALFAALRLPAPEILLRNIEPGSTLGIVNADGETRPFFLLRVSSYDRTFAGMLDWESSMERDLALFYPLYPATVIVLPEDPMATSSETSTESAAVAGGEPFRLSFTDEVIENHDVRVLRDAEDRIIMLYGYRDKQTLIIARSKEAFSELLSRLSSTRSR